MNPLAIVWNYYKTVQKIRWCRETDDVKKVLGVVGGEGFAESIDRYSAFIKV